MSSKQKLLTLAVLGLLSTTALADTHQAIVLAPKCLLANNNLAVKVLGTNHDTVLFQTDDKGINILAKAKGMSHQPCGGFYNVTRDWQASSNHNASQFLQARIPSVKASLNTNNYALKYPTEVNALLKTVNPQFMWDELTTFSSSTDRYSKAESGRKAALWLQNEINQIASHSGRSDYSVSLIETGGDYLQPSVVLKLGEGNSPAIVVGAHMDTLQSNWFGRMPGADDDGTGTVTVLETVRNVLNSHLTFKHPVYFIWYSAEEMGLVGSQQVVKTFKEKHIAVSDIIHFDMTGYAHKNDETMWLITDNTDNALTKHLADLIKTYVKRPIAYTRCGYACSDHATWHDNGFNSAIAFEAQFETFNPDIHSSADTMDNISLTHMTDYAKLAAAFVVERAEPQS